MATNTINLGLIDPKKMTALQRFIVGEYLHKNKGKIKIDAESPAPFILKREVKKEGVVVTTIEYTFKLPNSILAWERGYYEDSTPSFPEENRYRYEVLKPSSSTNRPTGVYGGILFSEGTIATEENLAAIFKEKEEGKQRVIKEIRLVNFISKDLYIALIGLKGTNPKLYNEMKKTLLKEAKEEIMREAKSTQAMPHAHSKIAVFSEDEEKEAGFIVMHRFVKMDFSKFLESIKPKLSLKQRLDVALMLLHSLNNQVHQSNLAHCDVKPANIMIDVDLETMEIKSVNFCDFGFSEKLNNSLSCARGTPKYMPPEQTEKGIVNEKSDLFSLGIIFANLFDIPNPRQEIRGNFEEIKEKIKNESDLFVEEKYNDYFIIDVIRRMTKHEKEARSSIGEIINLIEDARIDTIKNLLRKNEKLTKLTGAISDANKKAREARSELQKLGLSAAEKSSEELTKNVKEIIDGCMKDLQDEPAVIEEFVKSLRVKAFEGLITKKDITNRLSRIFHDLEVNRISLTKVKESLKLDYYKNIKDIKTEENEIKKGLLVSINKQIEKIFNEIDRVLLKGDKLNFVKIDEVEKKVVNYNKKLKELNSKFNFYHLKFPMESIAIKEMLRADLNAAIRIYQDQAKDQNREISERRKTDINDIKDFIDRVNTAEEMIELIKERIKYVKKGNFESSYLNFFAGSNLCNYIMQVIRSYEKIIALPEAERNKQITSRLQGIGAHPHNNRKNLLSVH